MRRRRRERPWRSERRCGISRCRYSTETLQQCACVQRDTVPHYIAAVCRQYAQHDTAVPRCMAAVRQQRYGTWNTIFLSRVAWQQFVNSLIRATRHCCPTLHVSSISIVLYVQTRHCPALHDSSTSTVRATRYFCPALHGSSLPTVRATRHWPALQPDYQGRDRLRNGNALGQIEQSRSARRMLLGLWDPM